MVAVEMAETTYLFAFMDVIIPHMNDFSRFVAQQQRHCILDETK